MLSSHSIPFQTPAVVSKKFYTLLTLVVLFHNANVLVKVLTLLFTQIFPRKQSKYDCRKCHLTDICGPNCRKLFYSSCVSFSYSALWWLSRKFVTTDFSECQVYSSASLNASSNVGSFMSSFIQGLSSIPTLSFSMLIRGNFSWRKANPLPSPSIAFTKSFIIPNLICKGGSSILFCSTRRWD